MLIFSRPPWLLVSLMAGAMAAGCSNAKVSSATGEPGGGAGGPPGGAAPGPAAGAGPSFVLPDAAANPAVPAPQQGCVNLQCQQRACPGGGTTSVSGTAYAPNGTLPLYNVAVYVPNAPLEPLVHGRSCDRCGTLASGRPIASALSDPEGKFKVANVPAGKNIPLVFQVGKWRRKVIIPEVQPCEDNVLGDPQLTRLPRNRSEGELPRVAVTTGICDPMSCTIAKLGVDPAEFGVSGQDTAFTFFDGDRGHGARLGPPGMSPAWKLWNDHDELSRYDLAAFSCLCNEQRRGDPEWSCDGPECRDTPAFDAVTRYLNGGGRVFGTDFEYIWLLHSPDARLARAFNISTEDKLRATTSSVRLDVSFPKGKALADWLKFVNPGLRYGDVPTDEVFTHMFGEPADGQVWGRSQTLTSGRLTVDPRFVTINTPVAAPPEQQCGRLGYLDGHVSPIPPGAVNNTRPNPNPRPGAPSPPPPPPPLPFPQICGTTFSDGEAVMVFFLFDLTACIQEDKTPPLPPPVID
jgi:hypothetical protein